MTNDIKVFNLTGVDHIVNGVVIPAGPERIVAGAGLVKTELLAGGVPAFLVIEEKYMYQLGGENLFVVKDVLSILPPMEEGQIILVNQEIFMRVYLADPTRIDVAAPFPDGILIMSPPLEELG